MPACVIPARARQTPPNWVPLHIGCYSYQPGLVYMGTWEILYAIKHGWVSKSPTKSACPHRNAPVTRAIRHGRLTHTTVSLDAPNIALTPAIGGTNSPTRSSPGIVLHIIILKSYANSACQLDLVAPLEVAQITVGDIQGDHCLRAFTNQPVPHILPTLTNKQCFLSVFPCRPDAHTQINIGQTGIAQSE